MPAITKIVTHSFTQDDGTITPYKRLAIVGVLNGETHTLELKLSKSELSLAQALLSSTDTPITEKELKEEHQDFQQGFES